MSGHTPGPWGWFGNEYGFYLSTLDRGRQFVMDFTRMGMRGAQPRFQRKGIMLPAKELVRFEVDRSVVGMTAGKAAESVYRYDIIDIDHPDARLMSAAPDLYAFACRVASQCLDPIFVEEAMKVVASAEGRTPDTGIDARPEDK